MKRKLLVFHPALAPYRIDLFNGLNETFDADFYFFRRSLISQKFDVTKLESQLNFTPKFLTTGLNLYHKKGMIRFGYLKKIILHKPDIIICSEFNILTFLTVLFTKAFFTQTEVYTFCDDSVDVAKKSSIARRIGRFVELKLLDGIILGNDFAEDWYNKNFPKVQTIVSPIIQKEERIMSIINSAQQISAEYTKKYNLKDKNLLLFVGRLVEVKNLRFLLEVFSHYIVTNQNAVLILIGDGDKKTELIKQVEELKIQDNIIFAGRFENEELYAWYRIADYFILPSISETFGAVVNESLIAGVPVICSNLAGASSLINKKNGVTFNPNDPEELLSVFKETLNKKRPLKNHLSTDDSLMPYTFNQRMTKLISFLKHDNPKKTPEESI
ncbi:MAG: glycosyltransferase family 4 protein [Bacteroidota bacterium]|nr:glycosyltransferase family 4 protein [Bacteroidota bacterium]